MGNAVSYRSFTDFLNKNPGLIPGLVSILSIYNSQVLLKILGVRFLTIPFFIPNYKVGCTFRIING